MSVRKKPQPVANYALCINIFIPEDMAACESHIYEYDTQGEVLNGLAEASSDTTYSFFFVR